MQRRSKKLAQPGNEVVDWKNLGETFERCGLLASPRPFDIWPCGEESHDTGRRSGLTPRHARRILEPDGSGLKTARHIAEPSVECWGRNTHQPEPVVVVVVVPVVGGVPVAIGRASVPAVVVPGAATQNTIRSSPQAKHPYERSARLKLVAANNCVRKPCVSA